MGKDIRVVAGPNPCILLNYNSMYPDFFCKPSQLWSSLLLSLQAVFSQPTAVPSIGLCSKATFQHLAPFHNKRSMTQVGVHCAVVQTMHITLTLSCLLQNFCRRSSLIFQRSLSAPADYPTVKAFSPFLPAVLHLAFSDFFLSFFQPTWLQGDFSCPFRCPKTSVNVQQVLCENWSI